MRTLLFCSLMLLTLPSLAQVYTYIDADGNRVFTDKPNWRGFKARSVVGGYYMKMLEGKLIGNKQ